MTRSKRFTLHPLQTCSLRHQLDVSGKHPSTLKLLREDIHSHIHVTARLFVLSITSTSHLVLLRVSYEPISRSYKRHIMTRCAYIHTHGLAIIHAMSERRNEGNKEGRKDGLQEGWKEGRKDERNEGWKERWNDSW